MTPLRDLIGFSHLVILLERSENLIRLFLLLDPLMAIIFLYHIHFTEVLQLPVFMPQNDSKQKFYRDPSSWNRKRQGVVNICSAREEDGEGKTTFYFLYYHHNCFFISCSLLKLNTAEHQIHSTGNKWKNCRWLIFFSTFWMCTGIRMHIYWQECTPSPDPLIVC